MLCVGIDSTVEGEQKDREQIDLPGAQGALVRRVVAANARTVVVLLNGGPLAVDWVRDNVATVLEVFEGGQSAGTALADVLFGDVNPSGMMPFTVYPADYVNQVSMVDMSMRAGPGRTYRFYPGGLWHFGDGLSYTNFTFDWSDAPQNAAEHTHTLTTKALASGALTYSVVMKNTGSRAGAVPVQAYTSSSAQPDAPLRQLFGLEKVFLQPGESHQLSFPTRAAHGISNHCAFCTVDHTGRRAVFPGRHTVVIGRNQLHAVVFAAGDAVDVSL